MLQHIKHIATVLTFLLTLAIFTVLCLVRMKNPTTYSDVEKRPLALPPRDVSLSSLIDKSSIEQFEDFSVDQFPFREPFRAIKASVTLHVLNQKQNNGYAIENGSIAQIKSAFDSSCIDRSIGRLSYIIERYLTNNGGQIYFALIPDKNYYFAQQYGYPSPDYETLVHRLQTELPTADWIDLFSVLSLEDYYLTDWHWDQSRLGGVLSAIAQQMEFTGRLPADYTSHTLSPFYGGYYDQSALYPPPETLTYLRNNVIDALTVYNYATGKTNGVYHPELFDSGTSYDFFMEGLQGLQRIDNPLAQSDRELIVFRDSYASPLLPLIAQAYRTVYVVDIRNVLPGALGGLLEFKGKDVLFLYSATVLDSNTFK